MGAPEAPLSIMNLVDESFPLSVFTTASMTGTFEYIRKRCHSAIRLGSRANPPPVTPLCERAPWKSPPWFIRPTPRKSLNTSLALLFALSTSSFMSIKPRELLPCRPLASSSSSIPSISILGYNASGIHLFQVSIFRYVSESMSSGSAGSSDNRGGANCLNSAVKFSLSGCSFSHCLILFHQSNRVMLVSATTFSSVMCHANFSSSVIFLLTTSSMGVSVLLRKFGCHIAPLILVNGLARFFPPEFLPSLLSFESLQSDSSGRKFISSADTCMSSSAFEKYNGWRTCIKSVRPGFM
mmetsp:Transcript_17463/g.42667  ORF Transcript_17463/g.42667 Transcript_17463/m.42667 type:complete len:296 (+) Transcript_17463:541-1428(+)